jgi:hypothetical protein
MALVAVLALNLTLGVAGLISPKYTLPADVVHQQKLDDALKGVESEFGEADVGKLCEEYLRNVGENNGLTVKGFKTQDPVFSGNKAIVKTVVVTNVQPFNLTCYMQKSTWTVVTAR